MSAIRAFIDSDVIISSLISKKGAAFFLLNSALKTKSQTKINLFCSNYSQQESLRVCQRMKLSEQKLKQLFTKKLKTAQLEEKNATLKQKFKIFTYDPNDCHIVAGAQATQAEFLITYNRKDYQLEKIKTELKIIVMQPAEFLQYLREQAGLKEI